MSDNTDDLDDRFHASVMAWISMANTLNNQGVNIYPALLHDLESTQRGLVDCGRSQAAAHLGKYVEAAQAVVDYISGVMKSSQE